MTTQPGNEPGNIAPWDDPNSWHVAALEAVKAVNDDADTVLVCGAAEPDGKHFVYARLNTQTAEELHLMLGHALAERRGMVVDS